MSEQRTPLEKLNDELFPTSDLHVAAAAGEMSAAVALLDGGADINARSWYGATALMEAVKGDASETEALRRLRDAFQKRSAGGLSLDLASLRSAVAAEGPKDRSAREQTAASGADSDSFSPRAHPPDGSGEPAAGPERPEMIRLLLEHGADVNAADKAGCTALFHAARWNRPEAARLLLDAGADIEARDNDGRTPLMAAVAAGRRDLMELLLERGADTLARNAGGASLLMIAAATGHAGTCAELIRRGAEVDAFNHSGSTALVMAAINEHAGIVKILRDAGATVGFLEAVALGDIDLARRLPLDDRYPRGATWGRNVLMWAAKKNRAEAIRLLVERGVDVNMPLQRGHTPLLTAVMRESDAAAHALLAAGADPNATTAPQSPAPLAWAAGFGRTEMVRALIAAGADVNLAHKHGDTPLARAVMHGYVETARVLLEAGAHPNARGNIFSPLTTALHRGDGAMVQLLTEHGAGRDRSHPSVPVEFLTSVRRNPALAATLKQALGTDLHEAAAQGDVAAVVRLLEEGRAVDARDQSGRTALSGAAGHGREEVVRLLIERGADVNGRDQFNGTPLIHASAPGYTAVVKLLLDAGASFEHTDGLGRNAVLAALLNQKQETVTLLTEAGAKIGVLEAALMGDLAAVRSLLDWGADVNAANAGGVTALMMAAAGGHEKVVAALLTRGAEVDAADKQGNTALTWASQRGNRGAAEALLDAGADPEGGRADANHSPLTCAAMWGHRDLCRLLLDRGADVSSPNDRTGLTPLHYACFMPTGRTELVRLLIERGADVNRLDKTGATPIAHGARAGAKEVVALLLQLGADPNRTARFGTSAIAEARQHGHAEIVEMLIQAGAEDIGPAARYDPAKFLAMSDRIHEEMRKRMRAER